MTINFHKVVFIFRVINRHELMNPRQLPGGALARLRAGEAISFGKAPSPRGAPLGSQGRPPLQPPAGAR